MIPSPSCLVDIIRVGVAWAPMYQTTTLQRFALALACLVPMIDPSP